jgi:hypothetical protein
MTPTVTSVSPNSGTSSTVVTISGTHFAPGATVTFAEALARKPATNVKLINGTTITANPPAGLTGTANVLVTVNGITSTVTPSDEFTYTTAGSPAILLRPAGVRGLVLAFALDGTGLPTVETQTRR